jgi:hypothetical protein
MDVTVDIASFVESVEACLRSVRTGPAMYAEHPQGLPSPSGAALATAVSYALGRLDELPADERALMAQAFCQMQQPDTGAFDDPSRAASTKRLNLPLFGWVLRALAMLHTPPPHQMRFLRRWDDAEELLWWLGLLEWQGAARQESLRVMNVAIPRINAFRRGVERLERSVRSMFNWLVSHQDRATGFWGTGQGCDLVEGLGATFHISALFGAVEQRMPMGDRIASTTMDLHVDGEGWGDSWAAMAAMAVLDKVSRDAGGISPRAAELATLTARRLAPPRSDTSAHHAAFGTLSEVLTRIEGLRCAAALSDDPALAPCRSWRSAWEPALWKCEW